MKRRRFLTLGAAATSSFFMQPYDCAAFGRRRCGCCCLCTEHSPGSGLAAQEPLGEYALPSTEPFSGAPKVDADSNATKVIDAVLYNRPGIYAEWDYGDWGKFWIHFNDRGQVHFKIHLICRARIYCSKMKASMALYRQYKGQRKRVFYYRLAVGDTLRGSTLMYHSRNDESNNNIRRWYSEISYINGHAEFRGG